MKQPYCIVVTLILALFYVLYFPNNLLAGNSAKGTLTVDGTTAQISNIYFDKYGDEYTIILTDNPVPADSIPFGIYDLSVEGKVRALKFTVSKDTKEMVSGLGEAIFFHPVWDRNIGIGEPEIKITKFDDNKLVGSIKTTAESESFGHKFSYDISFSSDLKKETPKISISGKSGPQVEAYSAYCNAIMEGNVDEFKKYVPSENLEMLPNDKNELILGLDFVRDTMMTDMQIVDINTTGNNSVLSIKGTRGADKANGKVKMLQENGTWKVSEESWEVN